MAAGTLTVVADDQLLSANFRLCTIGLPASYATGGILNLTAKFGFTSIQNVIVLPIIATAAGATAILGAYNAATDSIQLYWGSAALSTALAEVANTTSLAAYPATISVLVIGHF